MRACLSLLVFALMITVLPSNASADSAGAVTDLSTEAEVSPAPAKIDRRRARAGVAASSVGIVLSVAGLAAAGGLAAASGYSCSAVFPSTCGDAMAKSDRQIKASLALFIISPIALGASIFGLVRSKRTSDKAYPKEPRQAASWR